MKECRTCGQIKPRSMFARRGALGLQPKCKQCNAVYRQTNKRAVSAAKARWAAANPVRVREIKDAYWKRGKPNILSRMAAWKRAHPRHRDTDNVSRRLAHKNATPAWANKFFIEEAYDLAALRTKIKCGGVAKWHVDHIVPLRHPRVCGLHVEHNLRVIPAVQNIAKGNRYWSGMPA